MSEDLYFSALDAELKKQEYTQEDIEQIKKAYYFAHKLHDGQYRISEEPYIVHPVEVAKILISFKVDRNTIVAALLHDILEDTDTSNEVIIEQFGNDVFTIVDGVTKLGKYQFKSKEERQAESFRKMFIAMANDMRIIFLKLADRLHNMRTLNYMPAEKQKKIAQETLDIFAPLANRLGIGKIKAELEDLSLRYLMPEKYYEIAQLVVQKKVERDATIKELVQSLTDLMKKYNIDAQIQGRAKHYYSIYSKMKRLNIAFHDLYDISAVRVIVDDIRQCYEVLGIIHSQFKPIPGRFKDYIAMPKSNMYRSLHTSVLGPYSKPIEVQIRTHQMHEVAEYGVAAHWKYKETGSKMSNSEEDRQFSFLRKMVEFEKDTTNAKEFVENVKFDIFAEQVFAFTPMGDVIDLPKDATPVDFAFRIHSDVGNKTIGAKVNGRIAQLDTKLQNGDIVEIMTAKNSTPKLDWLNFVVTKQATSKIKQWFKKNNKESHIALGKNLLEAELTKAVFDEMTRNDEFKTVARNMNYKSVDDFFAALGYGETTIHKVQNIIKKMHKPEEDVLPISTRAPKKHKGDVVGLEGLLYNFARCCTPLPGEPIVGIVTRSKGVSIHRIDCSSLDSVPEERLIAVKWADNIKNTTYVANLKISAQDKVGVFKDILIKVADNNTNVTYANTKVNTQKQIGTIEMGIEVDNILTLNRVINALQALPEVYSVKRIAASSMNRVHSHQPKKKNK